MATLTVEITRIVAGEREIVAHGEIVEVGGMLAIALVDAGKVVRQRTIPRSAIRPPWWVYLYHVLGRMQLARNPLAEWYEEGGRYYCALGHELAESPAFVGRVDCPECRMVRHERAHQKWVTRGKHAPVQ